MTPLLLAFTFRTPGRLWLLLAVAALAVVYVVRQLRGRSYAVRFTNLALLDSIAPKRPGWRRHLPAALLLVALAGMVGAFAEPARDERVPRERATIIVAIDTSLSMDATDVDPSRLVAAQAAAKSFVDLLPKRLNVGLVTFNGVASIKVPPTQDREELRAAIDQLRLGERTAIGEAIYASLEAIKTAPEAEGTAKVPARIVLMSDGSTTVGRPDSQASAAAKKAKVPVSTIAFGTAEGTIEIDGQPGPVSVAVNPEALAKIANDTGGKAFTAATEGQLRDVYKDIGSSVGYTTEERDITATFVGISMVILFAAAVLSQLWFSRLP
ncbi:VWA domain-containing protein [Aquihabitans sp. G128]|uniref:VWA domain-containing protein n=1 Tax=Aquihabitans sp. G128 TaxID=2849779 RepID=UPI001C214EE1|nr:VWA domain-containing protein [Aquihabitans sp. G128]QXC62632.1 VWA domain-containing protein [Aquihabitans sp. G128]